MESFDNIWTHLRASSLLTILVGLIGCSEATPLSSRSAAYTDLEDLLATGLVYRDPSTTEPFSGLVYSTFPADGRGLRMRGRLVEGLLEGDVELFAPDGQQLWTDAKFVRGRECGVWRLNPFATLLEDSLFWKAAVESRVRIPFAIRRAMSVDPRSRSAELQDSVDNYLGGSALDSSVERSPGVARSIVYRTDNPECFDAPQNMGSRLWREDPYDPR